MVIKTSTTNQRTLREEGICESTGLFSGDRYSPVHTTDFPTPPENCDQYVATMELVIPPNARSHSLGSLPIPPTSQSPSLGPVTPPAPSSPLLRPATPSATHLEPSPKPSTNVRGIFSGGWRSGCFYCAIAAATLLLANLIFMVSVVAKDGYDKDGVGIIFRGGCKATITFSLVAHLVINAYCTILLGVSSYTMQCLNAPTRKNIDEAHKARRWLDIGVLSLRNLRQISRVRLVLWLLLAMSSIPLHFIYNSAIFTTFQFYPSQDQGPETNLGAPKLCCLQYSLGLMIAVIICNAVGLCCIVLVFFTTADEPLITIGDAIASFLNIPDLTTSRICTASKTEINAGVWKFALLIGPEGAWKRYRPTWFRAKSVGQWGLCYLLFPTSFYFRSLFLRFLSFFQVGSFVMLAQDGTYQEHFGPMSPDFNQSLQSFDIDPMIPGAFIPYTFLANLLQIILSFRYLLYNSIFTSMLLGHEWDQLSRRKQYLRVASRGEKTSTLFLQLPYKYMFPLMVASGLLHWLVSLSFFLVRVSKPYDVGVVESGFQIEGAIEKTLLIGECLAGIHWAVSLECVILTTGILFGFRRYKGGMPLVGSCSAAISAACHPDPPEPFSASTKIMWGITSRNGKNDSGHCAFSSKEEIDPVGVQWFPEKGPQVAEGDIKTRCERCLGVSGGT